MSEAVKILILMEGEKREKPFLQKLIELYGINAELYVFHTNIYNLYLAMEHIDFNGDLRDVLAKLPCMQQQDLNTLLNTKFAYTYLVFDCDAHHTLYKNMKSMPLDKIIKENLQRLETMINYFTDETDPSIGKLYVNYPMMESYRDCDDFFDENYCHRQVCIDDICRYKEITGQKKLSSFRMDSFTQANFVDLLRMNIYKLNAMLGDGWKAPSYKRFQSISKQDTILLHQKDLSLNSRCMDVLNTTLFLVADYYGNRDGFYDSIVEKNASEGRSSPT